MKHLFTFLFLLILTLARGQHGFWVKVPPTAATSRVAYTSDQESNLPGIDTYELSLGGFQEKLAGIPEQQIATIDLPTADGIQEFYIQSYANFSRPPATKYGFIKSYDLTRVDDPGTTGKLSIGKDGVMARINSSSQKTFLIEPATSDQHIYRAYARGALTHEETEFECLFKNEVSAAASRLAKTEEDSEIPNDGILRVYRMALTGTTEFSEYHLNDQGVPDDADITEKQAAVLSAMNTIVTRLNSLFEKELSARFELVLNENGENPLIFIESDEFQQGAAATTLFEKNQEITDQILGNENYDIGHVLYLSGGSGIGAAGLPSTCMGPYKANGASGSNHPKGDNYVIGVLSHELGHQFGANHVHSNNGSCNTEAAYAVEPGSGSTIMSYSGGCASNNYQDWPDDRYNAFSINEMWATMYVNPERQCYQSIAINNRAPSANAGDDFTVPSYTPLVLHGEATDPDGTDALTYSWEQQDAGFAPMPPSSTSTSGPAFRSFPPTTSPDRYLPRLSTVINGQTSSTWEVLPSVARQMTFSLMVRDNHPGGSQNDIDKMTITFVETAGSFAVTSSFEEAPYDGLSELTVSWDVGGTNIAPINSQSMNIYYSIDGGAHFDLVLLENTPNDGEATVTLPNISTTEARIMVKAADNIFYHVNSSNFQVNSTSTTVPDAPSQLTLSQKNITDIELTWTDNSDSESGFVIERATGEGEFEAIDQVLFNVTAFEDASITTSGNYTYRIAAFNATGNSEYSSTVAVSVNLEVAPEAPSRLISTKPDMSSVRLGWTDNSRREDGFIIERSEAGSDDFVEIARLETPNVTTFLDTELGAISEYRYRVASYNTHGTSEYSNMTVAKGVLPFITSWSVAAGGDVTLKISNKFNYNFDYQWIKDGSVVFSGSHTSVQGDFSTNFSEGGTYRLELIGEFPQLVKGYPVDQLVDVVQWGSVLWESMESAFEGYGGTISATDAPELSNVGNTRKMFRDAPNVSMDLSQWQVGNVSNMEEMFFNATAFNSNLGDWDVSKVVNMKRMFAGASNFNGDISDWDVSNVTTIANMFEGASAFNQAIGTWDVSSVTNMSNTFRRATSFNQDLSDWNTSSVTDMQNLFMEASAFNQAINSWQVDKVTNIRSMFAKAVSFNQDLSGWNTSSVSSLISTFDGAERFDQDLSSWDVTSVTNMRDMLRNSGYTRANYDKLLISWASQNVIDGLSLTVGTNFCDGKAARQSLIDDHAWKFTDNGERCPASTDIVTFTLAAQTGPAVIKPGNRTITIEVPFGTDVTSLTPTLSLMHNASSQPASDESVDFTNPVTYIVTSQDGTATDEWKVTVTVATVNTETDIASFHLTDQAEQALIDNRTHHITITVLAGTDVTALSPTITLSDGATSIPSTGEAVDFTAPVTYQVTAEDGATTQDWTVSVHVKVETLSDETDIVQLSLTEQTAPATIDASQHTVQLLVPVGTEVTSLIASVTLSDGATSDPASGQAVDFTSPVTYQVTAEDGIAIQDWTVTVQVGAEPLSSETDILQFSLPEQTAPATIDASQHTVQLLVPVGTEVSSLIPSVTLSDGATSDPASGQAVDFTNPVTYQVTAEDGIAIQDWTVTVQVGTEPLSSETDILQFSLPEQTAPATIDASQHTVQLLVPVGTEVSSLIPSVTLSDGATSDPASGQAVDFTNPVTYQITAEDGITTQEWTVTLAQTEDTILLAIDVHSWEIYPNPVTNLLHVHTNEEVSVFLTDINGKMMLDTPLGKTQRSLDLADLDTGIYLLVLRKGNKYYQQKILKK